jgi:predicted transcriptional regulator
MTSPDVAQSPGRARIYGAIVERPGISLTELCRGLGYAIGHVQYHLYVLQRLGMVHSHRVGRSVRYIAVGVGHPHDGLRLAAEADARLRGLLSFIEEHPGCSLTEASLSVGKSRQAGTTHVRRLIRMGLVEMRLDGNVRRLHPAGPPTQRWLPETTWLHESSSVYGQSQNEGPRRFRLPANGIPEAPVALVFAHA